MKQSVSFFSLLTCIILVACNSTKSEAEQQAELIQKTMKENSPGTLPTSENGYYMQAKFNGEDWSASHMRPDHDAQSGYKTIHGEKGDENITFQLWKRGVVLGKKIPFKEERMATLTLDDNEDGIYFGPTGEVEITKIDDQWMEGTFYFTGTTRTSGKKVEVKDGRFRVALVPGLK
ncbi:MAG TPA: DUF6252 family protein [Flavisolibacter sp.]|jgi:hypothetical protein